MVFGCCHGTISKRRFVECVRLAVVVKIDSISTIVLRRVGALQRRNDKATCQIWLFAFTSLHTFNLNWLS